MPGGVTASVLMVSAVAAQPQIPIRVENFIGSASQGVTPAA
jgi:hypothetical protein